MSYRSGDSLTSTLVLLYRSPRPLVNFALIAANLVVFVYTLLLTGIDEDIFFLKFGLIPVELTSGERPAVPPSPIPAWGAVFTSMFLHGGFVHILGNMLFLYGFGDKVEAKLGHIKYLLFYVAAGVAATWTQVATDMDSDGVLIGASGAIAGVVGAYLLAFPYRPALFLIGIFFILPLVIGFGALRSALFGGGGGIHGPHRRVRGWGATYGRLQVPSEGAHLARPPPPSLGSLGLERSAVPRPAALALPLAPPKV